MTLYGLDVRVAALEDIVASKEWADRPKDGEALPARDGVLASGSR